MARCAFTKRNGGQCGGVAVGPSGGCYAHDPAYELNRKRDARRNGKRGGRGRPNPGTADLQRLQASFEDLADKILAGTVDRADAAVAIQSCYGTRSCVVASARVRELEEVERRLSDLEKDLDPERGSREHECGDNSATRLPSNGREGLGQRGKIPITIPVCGGPWLTPAKLDGGSQSSDKRFRRNTAIPPSSYQMSGLVR